MEREGTLGDSRHIDLSGDANQLTTWVARVYGERKLDREWMTQTLPILQYKARTRYLR